MSLKPTGQTGRQTVSLAVLLFQPVADVAARYFGALTAASANLAFAGGRAAVNYALRLRCKTPGCVLPSSCDGVAFAASSRRFESQSSSILLEIPAVAAKAFMLLPGVKLRLVTPRKNAVSTCQGRMFFGDLLPADALICRVLAVSMSVFDVAAASAADLPRVCWLLAQLRATAAVDKLSRHLMPQLPLLYPHQLATAAAALGFVRLQHKFLLNAIAAAAMPYLSEMPAGDLLKLLQGYAGAQLHHYGLVSAVAAEIQRRVHAAAAAAAAVSSEIPGKGSSIGSEEGRSNAAQWKSDEVWIQEASGVAAAPKGQQRRQKAASGIVPSLEQLVDFRERETHTHHKPFSIMGKPGAATTSTLF
ncbi:uncharacterized protein LOC113147062 [Cyclospora cayetanensis]|uniref:Uncharacterized protein LOC113147062 n=1 Tax=Cyclospora cayetanensis TaxID=88456 RepID=A0A6P6RVZ5_9EIME|nr:uncharacterized protein LOC113147062 [Cyclospora cayetanensis]